MADMLGMDPAVGHFHFHFCMCAAIRLMSSVQKLNAKTGDSFTHVPKFAQSRAWFASTPMGAKKTRAFASCCRTARGPCRATRIC